MKILLGSDTYSPDVNGAARFTERLAMGLVATGHDVSVVCPSVNGPSELAVVNDIPIYRVRSHRIPTRSQLRFCVTWDVTSDVSRIVRELGPDVAHVQNHFGVGRSLVRAARRYEVPVVATNHTLPDNLIGGIRLPRAFRRIVEKWVWEDIARFYKLAQTVTAPTAYAVELLRTSAKIPDAVAISGGVDFDVYSNSRSRVEPRVPTVLFVGRLDPEKRVGELIEGFALLLRHVPAKLEIVGDGGLRARLEHQVKRAGIERHVVFHGYIDPKSLVEAYSRCDVFCMPSVAELQSLATLEAMASGKPVVAARSPALEHLVVSGRSGLLYRSGDVDELAQRLSTLLSDSVIRQRMGGEGAAIARGHAIGLTVAEYVKVYRDTIFETAGGLDP